MQVVQLVQMVQVVGLMVGGHCNGGGGGAHVMVVMVVVVAPVAMALGAQIDWQIAGSGHRGPA